MRLKKIAFKGVTRFRDAVSVDFDACSSGLIALVGANGEGKTTTAEIAMAVLDKQFPTRGGSIYEHTHGRDAFMEATFQDDGHELTVRLAIDAERRRTESYLLRDDEPFTDGRALGFEERVADLFGSRSLRLASVFAAQDKRGAFLGLPKTERKGLFLELLNLGALEVLAGQARDMATQASLALSRARDRAAEVEHQAEALADAPTRLAEAQAAADAAAGALDTARSEEAAAFAALERGKQAAERADALATAERTARTAAAAAARAVDEAEGRIPKAAAARDSRIRFLDNARVHEKEPAARNRHADELARIADDSGRVQARLAALPDLAAAEAHRAVAERDRSVAQTAAAEIAGSQRRLDDAERAYQQAQRDYDREVATRRNERDRLAKQADRLGQVPCTEAGLAAIAEACPLLADAREAKAALGATPEVDSGERDRAVLALTAAREAREALGDVPTVVEIDREFYAAVEQLAAARSGDSLRERLTALAAEHARSVDTLAGALRDADAAVREDADERRRIGDEYDREVMEADEAIETMRAALATARETHAAAEAASRDAATVDVQALTRAHQRCREAREVGEFALRSADRALAAAQAAADRLAELAPALTAARTSIATAETEVGDWTLLERSLGRDGVQALEIDAAGPEVARLTNDLLEACYGPRFSLTFETLAEKRDGGMKEVFDVKVYDSGAERPVEALSGGEKVVVGEALSLAIAVYNARKNAVRYETLWRDETAGALDPVNAQAYVRMLRRARELGGFHQIVFVSHQQEVWEAADAILMVEGGRVERRAA